MKALEQATLELRRQAALPTAPISLVVYAPKGAVVTLWPDGYKVMAPGKAWHIKARLTQKGFAALLAGNPVMFWSPTKTIGEREEILDWGDAQAQEDA